MQYRGKDVYSLVKRNGKDDISCRVNNKKPEDNLVITNASHDTGETNKYTYIYI